MKKRRKSRELAMQMLFQSDVGRQTAQQVRRTFWQSRETTGSETREFADELFTAAIERQEEIDQQIEQASLNWRIERMPAVDRNLLRMAIAELMVFPKTPLAVVINETLEIARIYSAPESLQFLNGILDAVGRNVAQSPNHLRPQSAKSALP